MIYNAVVTHESLLSKEIKAICGFNTIKKKKKIDSFIVSEIEKPIRGSSYVGPRESFEAVMTRLQMNTYLIIADFEYLLNRHNQPYGWGIARYTSPELLFGKSLIASCNRHSKEDSLERIVAHLHKVLPQATDRQIMTMSAKKDAIVNMGGFIAMHSKDWYEGAKGFCVQFEGYLTYGGMNGRDMNALAIGLDENTEFNNLETRIKQVQYLAKKLDEYGIPYQRPAGGHVSLKWEDMMSF